MCETPVPMARLSVSPLEEAIDLFVCTRKSDGNTCNRAPGERMHRNEGEPDQPGSHPRIAGKDTHMSDLRADVSTTELTAKSRRRRITPYLVRAVIVVLCVASSGLASTGGASAAPSIVNIGALLHASQSEVLATSTNGFSTGYAWLEDGTGGPFLWAPGEGAVMLSNLGGSGEAVNTHGDVTGCATNRSNEQHAFFWERQSRHMRDLGTLAGGTSSCGRAVNSKGGVAGVSDLANGDSHAFYWGYGSKLRDLGTLGGHYSQPVAINSSGMVVGYSETATGASHAFVWSSKLGMRDLGTLGGDWSNVVGVNDLGQVAGVSGTANNAAHPFLWSQETGLEDLGTVFDGGSDYPRAISSNGYITGFASTADGSIVTAFLWSREAGAFDIGTAGTLAIGLGVNRNGQVAGRYLSDDWRPFLWSPGSGMQSLPTLGGTSGIAIAVSDTGIATGSASTETGATQAVAWIP